MAFRSRVAAADTCFLKKASLTRGAFFSFRALLREKFPDCGTPDLFDSIAFFSVPCRKFPAPCSFRTTGNRQKPPGVTGSRRRKNIRQNDNSNRILFLRRQIASALRRPCSGFFEMLNEFVLSTQRKALFPVRYHKKSVNLQENLQPALCRKQKHFQKNASKCGGKAEAAIPVIKNSLDRNRDLV